MNPNIAVIAQTGINTLQTGALRMPCLLATVAAVSHVGELALRGISSTLEFLGWNGESQFSKFITNTFNQIRPYRKTPLKTLVMQGLALAAIGNVGATLVAALFGPAPSMYNSVLQWVGPIRVADELHPLITAARNFAGI